MIKLTLHNPETGKDETFTETYVKSRHLRQVVEFSVKVENGELNALDQMDEMITIVASVFSNEKVTFDAILDGLSAEELNPTLDQIMTQILGGRSTASDEKNSQ